MEERPFVPRFDAINKLIMAGLSAILFIIPSVSHAYFITWNSPSAVAELPWNHLKDAQGTENHTHNGGGTANGLFLGGLTETTVTGGAVGSRNFLSITDYITRGFTINRSSASEALTINSMLDASLFGSLTANPYTLETFSAVDLLAEVLNTGLSISTSFTQAQGSNVKFNASDSAFLAVDTLYTLKTSLTTVARSYWDGSNASSARANFLNTARANVSLPEAPMIPIFFLGLVGLLINCRTRKT